MSGYHEESPVNPMPPVVVALAAAIFGIEVLFQLGERGLIGGPEAVGWRLAALNRFALPGDVVAWMAEHGRAPWSVVQRFVTYIFVHASFTQAVFVLVFLLALGKMVGDIFAGWAVLVVFFGSGIVGALVYSAALSDPFPLIGGFPAVYGLIGAFTFLLWARLAATGGPQSRAFMLIGFLMGIQLIFGLLFGLKIDWLADLAGFAAGFGLSFVVSPGGWARVVARLRQR